MENKNVTKEQIEKMGIYELRETARSLGVSSPTTKKHAILVREIMKIINGELKVDVRKKRLGRPPKSISISEEKISSFLIPNDVSLMAEQSFDNDAFKDTNLDKLIFKNEGISFENLSEGTVPVKGFLRRTGSNNYYFWSMTNDFFEKEKAIFVPEKFIDAFSLRDGDKIEGQAKTFDDKNNGILSRIQKLNNEQIDETFDRKEPLDDQNFVVPSEFVKLFKENVPLGGRTLACFPDRNTSVLKLVEEGEKVSSAGAKVVFVGIDLPPEFSTMLALHEDFESFKTRFGDGLEANFNTIVNAINHILTISRDGRTVVVFVYDILGILELIELYYSNNASNKISNGKQLVKTLFGLGRCYQNGTSITVIASTTNQDLHDEFISKELLKVASCIIGF